MKMRWPLAATAGALACLSIPMVASPAAAATFVSGSCTASGVLGSYGGDFVSRTKMDPLRLRVDNTKADGYNVEVRLITYDTKFQPHYWSWHKYTGGHYGLWETSATTDAISGVAIQAATYNEGGVVNSCSSFPKQNPYF